MRARLLLVLAFALAATAAESAVAAPATKKPVVVPPFHAALTRTVEHLTVPGSVEVFSTRTTQAAKGTRIVSWTATWGDGSHPTRGHAVPKQVSHRYAKHGDYRVVFTVRDSAGHTTSDRLTVPAAGGYTRPAASLVARAPGELFSLEAGDIIAFRPVVANWNHLSTSVFLDFGDGTDAAVTGTRTFATVTHTYATPGDYTVMATARDSRGGVGTSTVRLSVGSASSLAFGALPAEILVSRTLSQPMTFVRGQDTSAKAPTCRNSGGTAVANAFPTGTAWSLIAFFRSSGTFTLSCSITDGSRPAVAISEQVTVLPVPSVQIIGFTGNSADGIALQTSEVTNGHRVVAWSLTHSNPNAPWDNGGNMGVGDYDPTVPLYFPPGPTTLEFYLDLDDNEQLTTGPITFTVPS